MGAATGRSQSDAVSQNEKELIEREVLGGAPSGGPAIGVGLNVVPTGRLRTSDHDGRSPLSETSYGYTTDEGSAFVTAVATVPGTLLGGQVKVSGLAGYNWVSLNLKSRANTVLDPNQFASATNESAIAGGTVLWALKSTYALATVVGTFGETKLKDSVDDCSPTGCNVHRYSFNTVGVISTFTAGHVFDLPSASGPKLDLRGSIGYARNRGDSFTQAPQGFQQQYTFSTWTGTATATLFSNSTLQNGALLRPYISAYVRQEFGYHNGLSVIDDTNQYLGTFTDKQGHTYGGLDAGLTYTLDKMTLGAAVYSEVSGDERTFGGRLGVSWKLNGDGTPAQAAKPSPVAFNWTGLYVGASGGYASANVDMTDRGPDDTFSPVGSSDRLAAKGTIAGGQIGYNWQIGGILVGVEGMWSVPSLKEDVQGKFLVPNGLWIADVTQLYSLTGRLGLASGSWLPYIKGGLAGARVETSMTTPPGAFVVQSKNWHSGWTIGGGVEYMLAKNWSVGIEYDYYNLDSKDLSAVRTGDQVISRWTVDPHDIQTITARMNVKLN